MWNHNAWDRVPPPDDQDEIVAAAITVQRSLPVSEEEKAKVNAKPSRNWYISWPGIFGLHRLNIRVFRDSFYKNNANNFFRDRNWCMRSKLCAAPRVHHFDRLSIEFPEVVATTKADARPTSSASGSIKLTCHSIGRLNDSGGDWLWSVSLVCRLARTHDKHTGAGNTVFPLLAMNKNPHLSLRAYDYSSHAVKLVQVCISRADPIEVLTDTPAQPHVRVSSDRQHQSWCLGLVVRWATRGSGAWKCGYCSLHLRPQRAAPR